MAEWFKAHASRPSRLIKCSEGVPPYVAIRPAQAGKAFGAEMFYVYIIVNPEGKHYTGIASDIETRLKKHNSKSSEWTKSRGPWKLLHEEEFETKNEALYRERVIKSYKGGRAFRKLLKKG